MKRLTALILALVLLAALSACGKDVVTNTDAVPSTTDPNTEMVITVPLSYMNFLSVTNEKYKDNIQLFCDDNDFLSYTEDTEAGTVTFTMTAFTYNGLLTKKGFELIGKITSLFESETYPYFTDIGEYNENFSHIVLFVDKQEFEKDEFSSSLAAYIADICMHNYQIFTTTADYSCTVTVKDAETEETISEKTYNSRYNS